MLEPVELFGGIAGQIREAGRLNRAHYGETQHYGKMIVGPPGGGPACRVFPQPSSAAFLPAQAATSRPPRTAADNARLNEAVFWLRSRNEQHFQPLGRIVELASEARSSGTRNEHHRRVRRRRDPGGLAPCRSRPAHGDPHRPGGRAAHQAARHPVRAAVRARRLRRRLRCRGCARAGSASPRFVGAEFRLRAHRLSTGAAQHLHRMRRG